jgi:hypothetical protein
MEAGVMIENLTDDSRMAKPISRWCKFDLANEQLATTRQRLPERRRTSGASE